jgi:hypothetical protein
VRIKYIFLSLVVLTSRYLSSFTAVELAFLAVHYSIHLIFLVYATSGLADCIISLLTYEKLYLLCLLFELLIVATQNNYITGRSPILVLTYKDTFIYLAEHFVSVLFVIYYLRGDYHKPFNHIAVWMFQHEFEIHNQMCLAYFFLPRPFGAQCRAGSNQHLAKADNKDSNIAPKPTFVRVYSTVNSELCN